MYLDLIMLLNLGVDYLLLLGTQRFYGARPDHLRLLGAALVGALYSGACLVPGFRFLSGVVWRVVFLGLISGIAFGVGRGTWRRAGVFILLSLALGGLAVLAARGGEGMLLPGAMLLCAGVRLLPGCGRGGNLVPLEIALGSQTLRLTALRDTGNTLRDPITGEGVLVLGSRQAQLLTGLTEEELGSPGQTLLKYPRRGFRLIPYRAVGQTGSLMLGLRMRDVTIDGHRQPSLVAFAPNGLGDGEYQALLGGEV